MWKTSGPAGHGSAVEVMAFSPDDRLLATGALDEEVHVRAIG